MEENRKMEVESVEKGMGNTTELWRLGIYHSSGINWGFTESYTTFKSQLRRAVEE